MDAANPLIYAGEGVIYAGASNELVGLAELLNAPVITTLKAKGACSPRTTRCSWACAASIPSRT